MQYQIDGLQVGIWDNLEMTLDTESGVLTYPCIHWDRNNNGTLSEGKIKITKPEAINFLVENFFQKNELMADCNGCPMNVFEALVYMFDLEF
jgi:hypothetical protein